jgi:hypothetical protein
VVVETLGKHHIQQEVQVRVVLELGLNGTVQQHLCRQQMLEVLILAAVVVAQVLVVQALLLFVLLYQQQLQQVLRLLQHQVLITFISLMEMGVSLTNGYS